jgi:hypothetical protein
VRRRQQAPADGQRDGPRGDADDDDVRDCEQPAGEPPKVVGAARGHAYRRGREGRDAEAEGPVGRRERLGAEPREQAHEHERLQQPVAEQREGEPVGCAAGEAEVGHAPHDRRRELDPERREQRDGERRVHEEAVQDHRLERQPGEQSGAEREGA